MSDHDFDLLLQEIQQQKSSAQERIATATAEYAILVLFTSILSNFLRSVTAASTPAASPASSVAETTTSDMSNHEQSFSKPHWTTWLPEIKRLETQHEAARYIEIEKEVARRKRTMAVRSIMDTQTKIDAAFESTESESDVETYEAPFEETTDKNNVKADMAMNDNTAAMTKVSSDSAESHPSTPELKSSFWVPGIEDMQLFNFDLDELSSSPSSTRSLSPPRTSPTPTRQGVQDFPCPPMCVKFKFNFPYGKKNEAESTPVPVGRRVATPKSNKRSMAKSKPDTADSNVFDDTSSNDGTTSDENTASSKDEARNDEPTDDELTTTSRAASLSTLLNDGQQALGEAVTDEVEDHHLAVAFYKMIGITKTLNPTLKREMRFKVEALVAELAEMERNADIPEVGSIDQHDVSTDEEPSSP